MRLDHKIYREQSSRPSQCAVYPSAGCSTEIPGGISGGATPVPIPNTEVKPSSADGTARETLWESRAPPGVLPKPDRIFTPVGLLLCPSKLKSGDGALLQAERVSDANESVEA